MAVTAGVLLHGRGRTPEEMLQLAAALEMNDVRWFAPAAKGGSWYPHRFMEPIPSNEPFLSEAIEQCDRAVDQAQVSPEQVAVIGFSQGACLALEYALRHPGRSRAIIAFTGGLIGPPGTPWKPSGSLAGTRVLITGGDIDEWVPESRVRESARVLADLGADVRSRIYKDRPHVVSPEEIAEAREFLTAS